MYTSPLHILSDLNADATEISDPEYLLRLRKKLLAEFNLSNSLTIDINGKAYSKDEVIKTIDVLLGNPLMPMHSFIFANRNLLDFLENDHSKVRLADIRFIPVPEDIKPMLSPVLLGRITVNLKKAFNTKNFDAATELLTNIPSLSEEEQMMLNEEINRNMVNLQEHLRSVRANGCNNILKELDYLKKNSLAVMLNKLPAEFIDTVNSFVSEVINTMVSYQKVRGHDRAYLYYVSNNLCKVQCDEDLMKLVKANHLVFTQNYEGKSAGSSSGGKSGEVSTGRVIYIILIAIVFIIRIATCSHRSSSYNTDYNSALNSMNALSALTKEKSEYEDFKAYREYLISDRKSDYSLSKYEQLLEVDSSWSGNTPFLYMMKRSSEYDYEDTSLRRVIIKNISGENLIIVAFDRYAETAKAYFFFDGRPDTLSFHEGEKLWFCFGDSLAASNANGSEYAITMLKTQYEANFKHIGYDAYQLLDKDFTLELKQKQKKGKKKKKTPLPVIKLDEPFRRVKHFENEKVRLIADDLLEESTVTPVPEQSIEEVSITPK